MTIPVSLYIAVGLYFLFRLITDRDFIDECQKIVNDEGAPAWLISIMATLVCLFICALWPVFIFRWYWK